MIGEVECFARDEEAFVALGLGGPILSSRGLDQLKSTANQCKELFRTVEAELPTEKSFKFTDLDPTQEIFSIYPESRYGRTRQSLESRRTSKLKTGARVKLIFKTSSK